MKSLIKRVITREFIQELIKYLKDKTYGIFVGCVFGIYLIFQISLWYNTYDFIYHMKPPFKGNYNFISLFFYFLIPPLLVILLTGLSSFRKVESRRFTALRILTFIGGSNAGFITSRLLYKILFIPLAKLPLSVESTLIIEYIFIVAAPVLLFMAIANYLLNTIFDIPSFEKEFPKLDFLYILQDTFRDMNLPHLKLGIDAEDGKDIILYFMDRFLHMLIIGPTGGGKSSMTILPYVYQDLCNKSRAVSWYNKAEKVNADLDELKELYKETKRKESADLKGINKLLVTFFLFCLKYRIKNLTKKLKLYKDRGRKYDLGITLIEPKGDLIDKVIEICEKYFPELVPYITIIDPLRDDSEILNVMQGDPYSTAEIMGTSLSEMQGGQKDFFAIYQDNVCRKLVLLLKYVHKDNCNIKDLERIMSSTVELKKEVMLLEKINSEEGLNNYDGIIRYFKQYLENDKMMQKFNELTLGLKSIIEQLTLNPKLNRIMCANSTINLDDIIREGRFLFINTAMGTFGELGHLFGKFCIQHYEQACFRRDIQNANSLLPNYTYIDEFPLYRNKRFVEWLTLGRGYRTSATIACQGLSGLIVNGNTELRDIVLSCARNKIVFGGISKTDAQIFSEDFGEIEYDEEMRGIKYKDELQGGISKMDYSYDERITRKTKPRYSASDIIHLDDRKVIVKIVKDRRIQYATKMSVDFLTLKKGFWDIITGGTTIEIKEDPLKDQIIKNSLNELHRKATDAIKFNDEAKELIDEIKENTGEDIIALFEEEVQTDRDLIEKSLETYLEEEKNDFDYELSASEPSIPMKQTKTKHNEELKIEPGPKIEEPIFIDSYIEPEAKVEEPIFNIDSYIEPEPTISMKVTVNNEAQANNNLEQPAAEEIAISEAIIEQHEAQPLDIFALCDNNVLDQSPEPQSPEPIEVKELLEPKINNVSVSEENNYVELDSLTPDKFGAFLKEHDTWLESFKRQSGRCYVSYEKKLMNNVDIILLGGEEWDKDQNI